MATTPIPANCAAVTEQLILETGRLQQPMYNRAALSRPIIRLQSKTRGAWQNGMGVSVSAVTFERSFAALTGDPWTTIAASDGDSVNACLPPSENVSFGQTTRVYAPKHFAVNTDDFCIRDIQFGWQFAEFLRNVTRALGTISEWVWARRYIQDYFSIAGHHLTLSDSVGFQDSPTGYNTANLPGAALSQGVLETIYGQIYREGADKPSGTDEATEAPVFTAIMSSETHYNLLRNNAALRQDLNYAYTGKGTNTPLVPGFPTKRKQFGGFFHELDPYPRRFIFTGGQYVEVAAFVESATTKGTKWNINPAWEAAPYEETIIWHEDVYQSLAVNTITNPAPGWTFNPQTWMGDFSPRNILDRTCNPDGTILFMRALFAEAARPVNPYLGYTILHLRCGIPADLNPCYGEQT